MILINEQLCYKPVNVLAITLTSVHFLYINISFNQSLQSCIYYTLLHKECVCCSSDIQLQFYDCLLCKLSMYFKMSKEWMFQSGTEAVSSVIFYLNPVLCLQMMAALYRVVCLYNKNKVRLRDLFL